MIVIQLMMGKFTLVVMHMKFYLGSGSPRRASARDSAPRSAVAREPLPAALGVVPDLLRVGRGEAAERRRPVARPHRHGPLLRERPAPGVARLVRAAAAALVSTRPRSATHAAWSWSSSGRSFCRVAFARLLRDRHRAPDRHHRDRELRVPQLSRARARRPAARRRGAAWLAHRGSASRRPRCDGGARRGAGCRRRDRRGRDALGWIFYATICGVSWRRGRASVLALPSARSSRFASPTRMASSRWWPTRATRSNSRGAATAARRGSPIRSATSRRIRASGRASTRRISRASSGISGSPRWRRGRSRRGWSMHRRGSLEGSPERARALPPRSVRRPSAVAVRTVLWQYWFTSTAGEARDWRLVAARASRRVRGCRVEGRGWRVDIRAAGGTVARSQSGSWSSARCDETPSRRRSTSASSMYS